jgi:hypothetical protein
LMLINLGVVGYVLISEYQGRENLVKSQRAGCKRGKLDRKDNADFQVAQTTYIGKVTGARSVHEDVKSAARQATITFKRTSRSLEGRSHIDCAKAFPKAKFIP